MRQLVSYKNEIARRFVVSAVDANTGDYIAMTQKDTTVDFLAQSAVASGSLPGIFPPQHLNGNIFFDGGTVYNVNIASAVNQCLDDGFSQEDIIIDVLICGYSTNP